jgi:hypothetical protein
MLPATLKASDFEAYPSKGKHVAASHLELLNALPPAFAAVLLREITAYDWKFPAERAEIDTQLSLLSALTAPKLRERMAGFESVRLNAELAASNFGPNPEAWMEQLTAWLWSSGQMDAFHGSANEYAKFLAATAPTPRPAIRRLGIVIIGRDAMPTSYAPFRKLRPHGLLLTKVKPEGGLDTLLAEATKRAQGAKSSEYRHWFIDGGNSDPITGLTCTSYGALQPPLARLLEHIQHSIDSGVSGPERLRSIIAQMTPADVGLGSQGSDELLDRFNLSLLTEGSGTQIFATTFVQWAARECLRRVQPETLVLRYAPRREVRPMNVMLQGDQSARLDPAGSLVDADMGAYYTWINMNRLSGADEMSFLVWLEGSGSALAIGPTVPRGSSSEDALSMQQVLALLA